MNNNWANITRGIGIAAIVIGFLRVFFWDQQFMDTIELFLIGAANIFLAVASKGKNTS